MKKILYSFFITASLVLVSACTEDEIDTYQGDTNIYFKSTVSLAYSDTISDYSNFSFAYKTQSVTKDTLNIPIVIQGIPADMDRNVAFRVVPETTTAQEKLHFTLPNKVVIPAGKTESAIQIVFNRTEDMKANKYLLQIELLENENFKTNFKEFKKFGTTKSTLKYRVRVDDVISKPLFWPDFKLGVFSRKKLFLMSDLLGLPYDLFNNKLNGPGTTVGEVSYYNSFMKRYLDMQRKAGTPILEEDGTEMIFP